MLTQSRLRSARKYFAASVLPLVFAMACEPDDGFSCGERVGIIVYCETSPLACYSITHAALMAQQGTVNPTAPIDNPELKKWTADNCVAVCGADSMCKLEAVNQYELTVRCTPNCLSALP